LLVALALPALARKWTSSDGKFSTEAEFVEYADGQVTLQKPDGQAVSVPIAKLSAADRRFVIAERKKPKPVAKAEPTFAQDIQPFVGKYCVECHNQKRAEHGYACDSLMGLTASGRKGAMVVPGKPEESLMVRLFEPGRKHMPPEKSPQPTADEMAKVAAWITAGAKEDAPPAAKPASEKRKRR
jgi:hypothetical protein